MPVSNVTTELWAVYPSTERWKNALKWSCALLIGLSTIRLKMPLVSNLLRFGEHCPIVESKDDTALSKPIVGTIFRQQLYSYRNSDKLRNVTIIIRAQHQNRMQLPTDQLGFFRLRTS